MATKREPKETDRKVTSNAMKLIVDVIQGHPEIEGCLWLNAFLSLAAIAVASNGITKEECEEFVNEFRSALINVIEKYPEVKHDS